MPSKPASPGPLVGQSALDASAPLSALLTQVGTGMTEGPSQEQKQIGQSLGFDENGVSADSQQFAGMGPWLELDAKACFAQMDGLVLRQELIARNHLAQDTHWTYVKLGYPWSTLTKVPNKDMYEQSLPYGSAGITIQAVPNKVWDLVNKTTETLLVDFPQLECEPIDDSEEAEAACDVANRFLSIDANEHGTNEAALYNDRVSRSLVTASTYIEYWTDRTGGGYVPLQILAHPQAESPDNPLIGPDQMPTANNVLRYVTAPQGGQFTDDPSKAAPQWQPKLRASKWGREHVRVFPESATVDTCEKLIILGFCTIGQAKKRWETVAQMDDGQISQLCDWTPTRFLPLLPPFQRARWQLTDGRQKEKSGSSDERIIFYYHGYARACPDYPRGADVVMSGALGGTILGRELNAAEVEVQKSDGGPAALVTETRCLEIPVVQITPRQDVDEQDPSGRAFVEMIAGASEHNAYMAMSFAKRLDQTLTQPYVTASSSPIEGFQIEEARASGDMLIVTQIADVPQQLPLPALPSDFFNFYELADEQLNSIAAAERAANGDESSKERSGKALQIAVERNNVSLTGMSNAVNNSAARGGRIKLERCMKDFSTMQEIGYVGEDGAYKVQKWKGVDFALVGKVIVKAGTGTLMAPDQKVQYLANLQAGGLLPAQEAAEAARSSYSKRLGLPPNPQEQYVERVVDAWLDGMPEGWMPGQPPTMAVDGVTPITQPTPPSWDPFTPRPCDTEPAVSAMWVQKLSKAQARVEYMAMDPAWRALGDQKYTQMRQAVAMASAAAQGQPPTPAGQAQPPQKPGQSAAPGQPGQSPQNAPLPHPRGAAA